MQIWGLEQHADTHAAYSEDLKTEGPARDRLLKQMDKASGRTQADREADAKKATERRKSADKDLADFRKKIGS
jgi:hypothetical protein